MGFMIRDIYIKNFIIVYLKKKWFKIKVILYVKISIFYFFVCLVMCVYKYYIYFIRFYLVYLFEYF